MAVIRANCGTGTRPLRLGIGFCVGLALADSAAWGQTVIEPEADSHLVGRRRPAEGPRCIQLRLLGGSRTHRFARPETPVQRLRQGHVREPR
ncbi:hypothetical protein MES4922_30425 [Mesorhizobium ventifaucium]|uniref:Uncharacterized protein n=1 Tax=Mesorhizobium ventifaucium TaxID=666020 RepID=A0ABM9DZE4_9HYPH|nr:hypothetical protein MES4922_30425 [Mesorhizobium ventifaucium]